MKVKKYTKPNVKSSKLKLASFFNRDLEINPDFYLLACAPSESTCGWPSDKRLKKNLRPISRALDKVMQIKGVTFDWKESAQPIFKQIYNKADAGVIAQDVEKILPTLVGTRRYKTMRIKTVNYTALIALLLESVKELREENSKILKRLDQLSPSL